MANTSKLRYKVEPWVRSQLETRFAQPFEARTLALSPGGRHEFDAVSGDGWIVASIKTTSGLTSGGKFPGGKVHGVTAELYFLILIDAPTRILILTNPKFHQILLRHLNGAIAPGIEVELIQLPDDLQAEVDAVIAEASREMSPQEAREAVALALEAEAEA